MNNRKTAYAARKTALTVINASTVVMGLVLFGYMAMHVQVTGLSLFSGGSSLELFHEAIMRYRADDVGHEAKCNNFEPYDIHVSKTETLNAISEERGLDKVRKVATPEEYAAAAAGQGCSEFAKERSK